MVVCERVRGQNVDSTKFIKCQDKTFTACINHHHDLFTSLSLDNVVYPVSLTICEGSKPVSYHCPCCGFTVTLSVWEAEHGH